MKWRLVGFLSPRQDCNSVTTLDTFQVVARQYWPQTDFQFEKFNQRFVSGEFLWSGFGESFDDHRLLQCHHRTKSKSDCLGWQESIGQIAIWPSFSCSFAWQFFNIGLRFEESFRVFFCLSGEGVIGREGRQLDVEVRNAGHSTFKKHALFVWCCSYLLLSICSWKNALSQNWNPCGSSKAKDYSSSLNSCSVEVHFPQRRALPSKALFGWLLSPVLVI